MVKSKVKVRRFLIKEQRACRRALAKQEEGEGDPPEDSPGSHLNKQSKLRKWTCGLAAALSLALEPSSVGQGATESRPGNRSKKLGRERRERGPSKRPHG